MRITILQTAATALGLCFVTGVYAHHSRANFDLETVVSVEGVVTEYNWRNPHVYATMDVVTESGETVEYLIEVQGTPILKRLGWDENSLQVGDKIVAQGNPDRDPNRYFIYLDDIITETGVLWGELPDAGFTAGTDLRKEGNARPEALQRLMADFKKANSGEISGDFVGSWLPIYGGAMNLHIEDGFFTPERNARTTAEGTEMLARSTDDDDPLYRCESYGIPYMSTMPFATNFAREERDGHKVMIMRYVFMANERVIHLDMQEHPEDIERSLTGHSIGWFEEDEKMLVIDTVGFAVADWGTARGIDQSEEKRILEKYRLVDDGQRIEYTSYTTDPPYLDGPLVRSLQYGVERGGRELSSYECDPASSMRHLTIDGEG